MERDRYKGFAPGVKDFTGIDIEKVQSIQAGPRPLPAATALIAPTQTNAAPAA